MSRARSHREQDIGNQVSKELQPTTLSQILDNI